jgi:DNA primase
LAILIQLLETMREHPHLKTAQLLERWRDTQQAPYMEKLAMQPLNLSPEQLEHELVGIVSRLNKQARDERYTYLINKGLSNLTESERIEINSYK